MIISKMLQRIKKKSKQNKNKNKNKNIPRLSAKGFLLKMLTVLMYGPPKFSKIRAISIEPQTEDRTKIKTRKKRTRDEIQSILSGFLL